MLLNSEPSRNRSYLNRLLPFLVVSVSALVLLGRTIASTSRKRRSHGAVAGLDPTASSFTIRNERAPYVSVAETTSSRRSTGIAAHKVPLQKRVLYSLLPWNASRLASWAPSQRPDAAPPQMPAAQLLVWQTENAVVINEVHRSSTNATTPQQHEKDRKLELAKRGVESLGGVAAAALCAADVGFARWGWVGLWVSSHSAHTTKLAICLSGPSRLM